MDCGVQSIPGLESSLVEMVDSPIWDVDPGGPRIFRWLGPTWILVERLRS